MDSIWPVIKLGEIAKFRNGINYTKKNFGKGIRVVGVRDFKDRLIAPIDGLDEINPEGVVRQEHLLRDGDIIFVRSNGNRELIGRSLLVLNSPEKLTHSAFTIRLRFISDKANPRYYAYLFKTPIIRKVLSAYGGGTNINNLNQNILNDLDIPLPPLPVQHKIATILSNYDDLIENNTRRIKILEEIKQLIYREWFVHFRFPGHEHAKMTDSELGKIPVGWSIQRLQDVCVKINSGGTPARKKKEYWNGGDIDWYKTKELNDRFLFESEEKITAEGLERSSAKIFEPDTILIAIYASPTVGRLGILTKPSCFNQAACALVANPRFVTSRFLYEKLYELRPHFNSISRGAAQQNISVEKVKEAKIVLPPFQLVDDYDDMVKPMYLQVKNLRRANLVLKAIRDSLLPQLLEGKIDISHLEIDTDTGD